MKIVAGNAGALTISLNGKTLEPLGPIGQVRVVRLTAEGPQFLVESPAARARSALAARRRLRSASRLSASSIRLLCSFGDQQLLPAPLLGADIDLAPELVEVRDRRPERKKHHHVKRQVRPSAPPTRDEC